MQMTENEIVRKFVRNGKEKHQIEILADLNAVSKECIKEILIRNGVLSTKRSNMTRKVKYEITGEQKAEILELHNTGYSAPKISEELDIPIAAVRRTVKGVIPTCKLIQKFPLQESAEKTKPTVEMIDEIIAKAEENLKLMKVYRDVLNHH